MKESVRFPTTDVLVPVSQLSTRDLFDFLENLKIKQDFFLSWVARIVQSFERRALWFPYSRLFFGIVFKRVLFLEYLGILQSQLWCLYFRVWHFFFRKMFKFWLVNEIINFNLRRHVLTWLKVDRHGFSGKIPRKLGVM